LFNCALALIGALAVGGINAFFIARLKVPSIIVTLGTMMVARGVAKVVTLGAQRNTSLPDVFGVKVGRHLTSLYLISALLASEFKAGVSGRATGYEFDALVITLLGGTSIAGGFGSVLGTVVGALILAVVTSAATGLLLSPDWQFFLKGVVTFLAILAQRFALDRRRG